MIRDNYFFHAARTIHMGSSPKSRESSEHATLRTRTASPNPRRTFEAWHEADPPNEWERTWNERVFDTQGNRMPFVGAGE